jgi:hypothetical protein
MVVASSLQYLSTIATCTCIRFNRFMYDGTITIQVSTSSRYFEHYNCGYTYLLTVIAIFRSSCEPGS